MTKKFHYIESRLFHHFLYFLCFSSKTFQSYHSCQLPPNRQLITRKFDPSYSFSHLSNSSNMEHTPIRVSRFFYTYLAKSPISVQNAILTELYFSYLNFCAIFCQFVISRTFLTSKQTSQKSAENSISRYF